VFSAGLCGSALADGDENVNFIWQLIKGAAAFVLKNQFCLKLTVKSL